MGYEVKMIVGELGYAREDGGRYFLPVAMVDLCKPHRKIEDLSRDTNGDRVVFYGYNGNTKVMEDMYGKALTTVKVGDVLAALMEDVEYRRYAMAIHVLEDVESLFPGSRMAVVLFGY